MTAWVPSRAVRPGLISCIVLVAMALNRALAAHEPIRGPARAVEITPTFEPERLPNPFEGEGVTWVASLAFSPDGTKLAVGDCATRPLCMFPVPVSGNENGGRIRIVDVAARRAIRTIRPVKRPRHEYEILGLACTPDGRTLLVHGREVWPRQEGGREVGYHVTAWDPTTISGADGHVILSATFSPDAKSLVATSRDPSDEIGSPRSSPSPPMAGLSPRLVVISSSGT